MREFDLIERFLAPLAGPSGLGLRDDAALLRPPPGSDLVVSADAMVAGVHFLADDPPDLVARKLLRVNLSDLAAMGAAPLGYLLTLAVPGDTPEAWFAAFAAGLGADQVEFGISLLGGDTVSTPGPVCLSATVLGQVAPGAALRRCGAAAGDGLWVTGTIGDSALGLRALRGELADPDGSLADRYRRPQPRLGLRLAGIASAAMDVSDGLVQDCGHLARASGLAGCIEADTVPRSPAARVAGEAWLAVCLNGGDDYELLLAVPPGQAPALLAEAARAGVAITRIGECVEGTGVTVTRAGREMEVPSGWGHF